MTTRRSKATAARKVGPKPARESTATPAEESIEERTRLLTALIDNAADTIIFSLDREYRYTAFNALHREEMRKVWQVEIELGMNLLDAMTIPELRTAAQRSIDRALAGEVVLELQHQPDTDVYHEFAWSPVRTAGGDVVGVTAFIRDITERKRAEEALHESVDRFRYVFDYSSVAKSITQVGGEIDANAAFCKMLGYAPGELIGQRWQEVSHPGDIAATQREVEAVISGVKIAARFVKRYIHKDGSIVVGDVSTALRRDDRGEPLYFMTTVVDITEQRDAEEALRLKVRIADIFLTHANDEMYGEVLDVVMETVQSEYGLFGYLDSDGGLVVPSMTRRIWDQCQVADKRLIFPRDMWGDTAWTRTLREQRLICSNEASVNVPAGHVPIRRSISLPIVFHDEVIGLFQVANKESDYTAADATALEDIAAQVAPILAARLQQQRAEEQIIRFNTELEQRVLDRTAALDVANQDLESFAYSVSHDLRAPLRHVVGFSQLLTAHAGEGLDDKSRHYLDTISAAVATMGVLIDDLLEFSRGGRGEMHLTIVDMDALMHETVDALGNESADRAVEWTTGTLPDALGDKALLRQVWANLLSNALKFTRGRDPARIELGARQDADEIVYFVRDNGVGFDMTYVDKLFGVFQRLHSSSEFKGAGIGLATVRRIVNRLGGTVWAEGKVDEGATFFFSLPRRKETSP